MELTEKKAHCIARLLQAAIYGDIKRKDAFMGCQFCKYLYDDCWDGNSIYDPKKIWSETAAKITQETGVDLEPRKSYESLPALFIDYKRFLKNANEPVRACCKNFFNDI